MRRPKRHSDERHGKLPDYEHEILSVVPRYSFGEFAPYTYTIRESDSARGENSAVITVALRRDEQAPNGVVQLMAHESFVG